MIYYLISDAPINPLISFLLSLYILVIHFCTNGAGKGKGMV